MRPSELLDLHRERIREIVTERGHSNVRVFGSVARGEDDEISDVDLLFDPGPTLTLFSLARLQKDIQDVLGVDVDLRTPSTLPDRMRERVLKEAIAL